MTALTRTTALACALTAFATGAMAQEAAQDLRFAGALEFSDKGTLFVGDNHDGAIYAFDMTGGTAPAQVMPVNITDIDVRIADAFGVASSALAIMEMEYHDGGLFIAGVAFNNVLSTLRRMPFPFTAEQSAANIEMYHISHDQYEIRAPIRAMSIHEIKGEMQLVAAYTCSPVVLIGLDEIVDGAQISARTIMDYGNGQPMDMVAFNCQGDEMLFLTNNSRSPHVLPVAGFANAQPLTPDDFPCGGQVDMSPRMPAGDFGTTVMFDGASLQIDALGENMFVSLTRDIFTGSLNMDSNWNGFPSRLHNLVAEFDFPQYYAEAE